MKYQIIITDTEASNSQVMFNRKSERMKPWTLANPTYSPGYNNRDHIVANDQHLHLTPYQKPYPDTLFGNNYYISGSNVREFHLPDTHIGTIFTNIFV